MEMKLILLHASNSRKHTSPHHADQGEVVSSFWPLCDCDNNLEKDDVVGNKGTLPLPLPVLLSAEEAYCEEEDDDDDDEDAAAELS
jgi:hypothetical protein